VSAQRGEEEVALDVHEEAPRPPAVVGDVVGSGGVGAADNEEEGERPHWYSGAFAGEACIRPRA
jgi:hypothetical protein